MSPQLLASLPVMLPMTGLVLCLAFWRALVLQRVGMLAVAGSLLVASVAILMRTSAGEVLAVRLGGWPAEVAITLVIDQTSAIMVLLNAVVAEELPGPGTVFLSVSSFAAGPLRALMPWFHSKLRNPPRTGMSAEGVQAS